MELNARQRRALEAICDTFAPGAERPARPPASSACRQALLAAVAAEPARVRAQADRAAALGCGTRAC